MRRPQKSRDFVLVTQYYPPERGAAQVRLGSIVEQLVRRGHRVEVVTSLPNYPIGRIFDGWSKRPIQFTREGGIRVIRLWSWASMGSGLGRALNFVSFGLMSVPGVLASRRADHMLVEYPTLFGALPAVVLGRLRRQRVNVIVADLWVDVMEEIGTVESRAVITLLRRLELWMLLRAHVVTVVTEGFRDVLVGRGIDPERVAWLPNGADVELFAPGSGDPEVRAELGLSESDSLIVYAGTHGYVHGLEVVLEAADLLRNEPVVFLLVGGGSEKEDLQQSAAERGLDNVIFRDPVDPSEVARLLRASVAGLATVRAGDLYSTVRSAKVFPTMAAARPVIYSANDEGSRLVSAVGAGLVTPPGDAAALAESVRTVLSDPALAERLGAAGREWVCRNASWDHLVGNWLAQIDQWQPA